MHLMIHLDTQQGKSTQHGTDLEMEIPGVFPCIIIWSKLFSLHYNLVKSVRIKISIQE